MHETSLSALGGGASQAGGRAYNERLAISLIRLNGPLPRAELARLTGLSAQTLSNIIRRLEEDGLLVPLAPLRGRIGQPSTPYALNAEAAFSFGIKIGRRSSEIVLCDFLGGIRARARLAHAFPAPEVIFAFIVAEIARIRTEHAARSRITGIGIAMPFEMWTWAEELAAPRAVLEGWKGRNVAAELSDATGLAAYLANDATAACGAELLRRPKSGLADWLYIFIGSFVGGGIVLGGALFQGRSGNAGALGSMPVWRAGEASTLIKQASLITLEAALRETGLDPLKLLAPEGDWAGFETVLARWIEQAASGLAVAIIAGASIIDFSRIVIDGAMPRPVLARLVDATRHHCAGLARQGLSPFEIEEGAIGADARALGGAILPMIEKFFCGIDVLLKR